MVIKCNYVSLLLTVLLASCAPNGPSGFTPASQPSVVPTDIVDTWTRMFAGPNYGAFFDVVVTEDGTVLAVGATNHLHVPPYSGDALFIGLTLDGDLLWEQTWGGDGFEQAVSAERATDGGFYIFGETDSYGAGDRDFFLLKLTENGTAHWFRTFGSAYRDWPYGMLPLSDGDLLLYGFTETSTTGERSQYVIRVTPYGDAVWEYVGETVGEELVLDALQTEEGALVLAVVMDEDGGLVKLDHDGNILWTTRFELPGWQYASQIAHAPNGGFFLAGFSMDSGPQPQADTWLARCNSTGELQWETSFGDSGYDDYATSLIPLRDGTYLIGAIANGMLLSRVDEDGSVLWRRALAGQSVYGAMALVELEQGGYLVAGLIQLINGRSYDAILFRTDTEGRVASRSASRPVRTVAM